MLGPKREHKPAKKRWQLELEEEKDPQASPTKEEKEELERLAADEDVADDAANDAGENAEAGQEEDEPKKDVSNEENQPEIEDQSKKRKHFAWMDEDDEELYGDEDSQPEEDEVDAHDNNDKTPAAASGDKDELDQVRFAFVSNISFDARLEDLKVFFQSCGPILSIVPDPHQSNTSSVPSNPKFAKADHKGRAYVEFRTYQALRQALELDEQKFMGRPLRIVAAYKRNNGEFGRLQTNAHIKFFQQQQQHEQGERAGGGPVKKKREVMTQPPAWLR